MFKLWGARMINKIPLWINENMPSVVTYGVVLLIAFHLNGYFKVAQYLGIGLLLICVFSLIILSGYTIGFKLAKLTKF